MIFVVVGGALLLVIIWGAIAAQKAEEARKASLVTWAAQNGFEFSLGGLSSENEGGFWETLFGGGPGSEEGRFMSTFRGFQPFGIGHSHDVGCLMTGRRGEVDWYLFDYTYKVTSSNGKTTTTTTYPNGIFVVRIPFVFPSMSLSEESFFSRVGALFGAKDVEFESDEFNRRYHVRCDDSQAAYDLIHPQMMEFLMAIPALHWQMAGPFLMIYQRRYLHVADIEASMQLINAFLERIPNYVHQDRGFEASWTKPLDGMGV